MTDGDKSADVLPEYLPEESLEIVILGSRGVPATYGGVETGVQEIGSRLAARGHRVTVYCRSCHYREREPGFRGMRRVFLPCVHTRFLETLSHTFICSWHALFRPADVFFAFNVANILALLPLRLRRAPLLVNADGLEWKRRKWDVFSKRFFKTSERLCLRLASRVVTDSAAMGGYYRSEYGAETATIAYGAETAESSDPEILQRFGVEPRGYFLQVARFEPENNLLLTAQSFLRLETDKKLLLVGGAAFIGEYQRELAAMAGDRIVMPGFVYEADVLREFWANCFAYVHGNEVGGTNPGLLQAMAHGCFILSRDVIFNREPLGGHARYFSLEPDSLLNEMRWTLEHEDSLDDERRAVREIVAERYSWDRVTDQYEALFRGMAGGSVR